MRKINAARSRNGRGSLSRDKQIGYVARKHAGSMATSGGIFHNGNLGGQVTKWARLAENVGRGGSCDGLFQAFMSSSGHRANVLGKWRHMGVGAEWHNGTIYVVQVFEATKDPGNVWRYP